MNLRATTAILFSAITGGPYRCFLDLFVWIHPQGSSTIWDPADPIVSTTLSTSTEEHIIEISVDGILTRDYPLEKFMLIWFNSTTGGGAWEVNTEFQEAFE